MRPILSLLAFPLLLAGCAPEPAATPAPASDAPLHTFAFFVSDLQARDARIADYAQADCGMVAIARVSRIPIDDDLILPDLVVQYDQDGGEIKRWAKSYSSEILAISGDDLFFGASPGGDAGPFRTTPTGEVAVAVPLASNLEANARYVACPEALPSFSDMSLVNCYQTTDVAGRPLNLAWEAGCPTDSAATP
ncbi:MAG: hypothetical protein K0M70_15935 [Arenimonas sp.]|uniref:hypothetical protein n=1 Tax=Arenimonas sp. TaxID=1872635 RepID=UPI0025BCCD24|nr:hypothetical protein [Arenimonas sp.]MBW8369330.1 hypothetical protein [Arenimonas sp.]